MTRRTQGHFDLGHAIGTAHHAFSMVATPAWDNLWQLECRIHQLDNEYHIMTYSMNFCCIPCYTIYWFHFRPPIHSSSNLHAATLLAAHLLFRFLTLCLQAWCASHNKLSIASPQRDQSTSRVFEVSVFEVTVFEVRVLAARVLIEGMLVPGVPVVELATPSLTKYPPSCSRW